MIRQQPPASEGGDRAGIVSSKIPAESANGRRQRPACCVPGVRGAGGKYGTTTNHELCRLGQIVGRRFPSTCGPLFCVKRNNRGEHNANLSHRLCAIPPHGRAYLPGYTTPAGHGSARGANRTLPRNSGYPI